MLESAPVEAVFCTARERRGVAGTTGALLFFCADGLNVDDKVKRLYNIINIFRFWASREVADERYTQSISQFFIFFFY